MADWNTTQYLKFENQRTQPAKDLALRVSAAFSPLKIADIGCGPGNSTAVLKKIFPTSYIVGIDNSQNMIKNHTALVDWVKGTRLRPYLDFLGGKNAEQSLRPKSHNVQKRCIL